MVHRPSQYQRGETAGIEDAALGLAPCNAAALARQRGDEYARGYRAGYGTTPAPAKPEGLTNRRRGPFRRNDPRPKGT